MASNCTDDPIECVLLITLPNEDTTNVNIKQNDTLLNLKNIIKEKSNIPVEQQEIIFKGNTLMNDKQRICGYDIENESQLTVIKNDSPSALAKLLSENNLYDALYKILANNDITLALLDHLKHDEIEELANNLEFNIVQKLKLRQLMQIVSMNKPINANVNHEVKSNSEDDKSNQEFRSQMKQLQKEMESMKRRTQMTELKGKENYSMNIALIGDMAVGKTSLIRAYIDNQYFEDSKSSIGIGHYQAFQELTDKTIMKIAIWDTAGQERYADVCSGCYKRADVILVCYDSGEKISLDHCENWRKKIEQYNEDVFVILVACKTDLCNTHHKSQAEIVLKQKEWKKFNAVYCECSAKKDENVTNVFLTAAETIAKQKLNEDDNSRAKNVLLIDNDNDEKKDKKGCCIIL